MSSDNPFTQSDVERAKKNMDNNNWWSHKIADAGLNQFHIKEEAEKLLKKPELLSIILKEFDKKIIGEQDTKLALFVQACGIFVQNRKIAPHVFVNSESSAGKSVLTKAICNIFPENRLVYRTKISPEVLTYWHKNDHNWTWNGKILYLEDVRREIIDSPVFKVMASEGSLATVVINQKSVDIIIKGVPIIFITTANVNPNQEIINRFSLVSLDESSEQTHNVIKFIAKQESEAYSITIKMALTLLNPIRVKVPFMDKLVDSFPIKYVKTRRDFVRFMEFIKCSTALYQFQRDQNEAGQFLATKQDYEIARAVLKKVSQTDSGVSLTHKKRKAFEICQEVSRANAGSEGWFQTKEVIAKGFVSQRMWYAYLKDFVSSNLLESKLDDTESKSKASIVYRPMSCSAFVLPEFEKLSE